MLLSHNMLGIERFGRTTRETAKLFTGDASKRPESTRGSLRWGMALIFFLGTVNGVILTKSGAVDKAEELAVAAKYEVSKWISDRSFDFGKFSDPGPK